MICFKCFKPIRGADVARRVEWRKHASVPGGNVQTYIYGEAPGSDAAGPLRAAHGTLVRLSHNKCYHAWKKQQDLAAARAADPSAQPGPEQDWRHQEVLDVEDLKGAGD